MRLAVLLLAAAIALAGCGDDKLADIARPAPATEQGGAHHFDVERVASGLNRPTGSARRPATRTRCGCSSSPAASCGRATAAARRCSTSRPGAHRLRAGPARDRVPPRLRPQPAPLPALDGPPRRHPRRRVPRRRDRTIARARARAADGRPARGEPQRRPARLRARRPAVPRPGRRRRRVRPARTAQDPRNRLGKVLAVDVDAPRPRWGVVLTGLRNPWRFCSTRRSARSGSATSARTRSRRSTACCSSPTSRRRTSAGARSRAPGAIEAPDRSTATASSSGPSRTYEHDDGCSVTGGLVYRGAALPGSRGLRLRRLLHRRAVDPARYAGGRRRPTSGASGRASRS